MKSHRQGLQHNKIRTEINPPKTRTYTALNVKELKLCPHSAWLHFQDKQSLYSPHNLSPGANK